MEILDDFEDYEEDNPGTEIVLAENFNPDAADACSLAADYRAEGMSPRQALKAAWREVKGENPEFQPSLLSLLLVGAGIFVAVWKWRKGYWPWRDLLGNKAMGRRLARPMPRPNPGTANPGTVVTTSPAQLGRSWASLRQQGAGLHTLAGGVTGSRAQSGASGEKWPRAV